MTIHRLDDVRDRRRAAADDVFAQVEREVIAARDTIMASALRRLAQADPSMAVEPAVQRLGALWVGAWPYDVRP